MSAIPFTEPKETQTAGQAAAHSRHAKKDKQNKAAAPTKKKTEDKTTKASRNAQQKKSVKSVKKARAAQTDKTSKTSRMAVQKEAAKQPKEETESPHQDTEDYPRLVQEFTAYYNKYQQLRQKVKDHPEILQGYQKDSRYSAYASSDYRCVFRISFKKECILIEWPSQKKNRPDHSDEREPGTDVQTLLQLLCSDLHASSYRESQLSYTSDARIDNLLFDTDSEIFLSALILAITAALTLAIAWYHGKIGLGAAYFLSMGIYIVLPTIVRLFLAKPTHPGKTGNT